MRNYDPTKTPSENNRLTLADQAASGATAAGYQWPATQEEVIARALSNANQMAQGGGTGINPAVQDALDGKIDESEKGEAGGVAQLDGDGLVPVNVLPENLAQIAEDGADGIASILNAAGNRIGGLMQEEPPQMGADAPTQFPVFFGEDSFFVYQAAETYRATIGANNAGNLTTGTVAIGRLPVASVTETITGSLATKVVTPAGDRAALAAYVDPIAMLRAPMDGMQGSDGATPDRRVQYTLNAATNPAGSALTESAIIYIPTTNPATVSSVVIYGPSATSGSDVAGAQVTALTLATSREMQFRVNTDGANRRLLETTGFASAHGGRWVHVAAVFTPGATAPALYVNGALWTSWAAPTVVGTPPDWMAGSLSYAYRATGYNWTAGELRVLPPLNRAVSAAEVAQMVQRGGLLSADRLGGSAIAVAAGGLTRRHYRIATVGSTDFTLIGASANTVGVEFLATGAGAGTGTALPIGAMIQPEPNGTSQYTDRGPNGVQGQATAGMRITCDDADLGWVEYTLTTTGAFLTGGSGNPLVYGSAMIDRAYARADTAGADITLRNNSSSTNDIVTAATDLPTANIWVPLTIIDAQRSLAANATLWGSASAGTIKVRVKLSRTN